MTYKIRTIVAGEMTLEGKTEPVHLWYVEGNGIKALVDVGMPDAEIVESKWKTKTVGGGRTPILSALSEWNVSPEDINYLILTHLHFDHAWNIDLFPHAQAIVQEIEIKHAIKPLPLQRGYYSRQLNADLISRQQPKNLLIINGNYKVAEGFELIFTPGHTPGSQSAIIDTDKGKVGLCSDTGPTYRHWYPSDPEITDKPINYLKDSCFPDEIHTEGLKEYLQVMEEFMEKVDIVVPSHDKRIPKKIPEQWWAKPVKITN